MAEFTQKNRPIGINTPLGPDVLLLRSCNVTEKLGGMFEIELDLLSEDFAVKPKEIIGQNVTIRMELSNKKNRHFNGYINNFSQVTSDGLANYNATVVPWLWLLTKTSDCRIFQKKTVPDIIKDVFREHGFTDFEDNLRNTYREWEYCVQYRETDFNFVSRLMEQEGIYYYFKHQDGLHKLALMDDNISHEPFEGYKAISYLPFSKASTEKEHIRDWSFKTSLQTGEYTQNDFDFKVPDKNLLTKKTISKSHPHSGFEVYDYPGEYIEYSDGENYSVIRIDEVHTDYEIKYGESDARGICTGCIFDLKGESKDGLREDQCASYLITSASYHIQGDDFQLGGGSGGGELFSCSFTAIDLKQQFRTDRMTPKPSIAGPQTAIVVGPSGDEIHTDEYGRVKVQFHWDREGKKDENSSCWIRVAQVWAGKNWGAMYIPRIGHEVIVEFLEGDPDQPIITGRVYNSQNMPPYGLPTNKTRSTIKSNSSKGGGGSNELRFEDKKGSEEVFLHGQKDWTIAIENDKNQTVGHDETMDVGNNRTKTVGVDQSETVGSNKTIQVGTDHTEDIGSNKTVTIGQQYQVTVGTMMNETVAITKAEEIGATKSVNVGVNSSENVGGNKSVDAGKNVSESAGKKMFLTSGDDFGIKGDKKGVIEIKDELTIKCGKASITLKKNGDINIKGKKINVKGKGDIIMKGKNIKEN